MAYGGNRMRDMSRGLQGMLMQHAREYVNAPVLSFTQNELKALLSFFTNTNRRVFFMYGLPENILAVLSAMYSRMKNTRGLRGVFVDAFLPAVLAARIPEIVELVQKPADDGGYDGNIARFLKEREITTLDQFIAHSPETAAAFDEYLDKIRLDPEYLKFLSDTALTRKFLSTWLDAYGHNSIARMGSVHLCLEGVSILAAKSIEWSRPGAGYVELSTRYVDLKGADVYPIADELALLGADPKAIRSDIDWLFEQYRELLGDKVDGIFPSYLTRYESVVARRGANLSTVIAGEAFDVLGNLLPCCTLTSLAVTVTGEAFPGLLKHLLLDETPENAALVELIVEESAKIGCDQFARHYTPTPANIRGWEYLSAPAFQMLARNPSVSLELMSPDTGHLEESALLQAFRMKEGQHNFRRMSDVADYLFAEGRAPHDKLPSEFELVTTGMKGVLSFRSWRDAQRMGFSTHNRTRVTPYLGFYQYDKPAPPEVNRTFGAAHTRARRLYSQLDVGGAVPAAFAEFVMPMGCRVGATYFANLTQHDFCAFQRSKGSVNHEVRQWFLGAEGLLRERFPWWEQFSTRAVMTPVFLFARGFKEGQEIPLDEALEEIGDTA